MCKFTPFEKDKTKFLRCNGCGQWLENKGNNKQEHEDKCFPEEISHDPAYLDYQVL